MADLPRIRTFLYVVLWVFALVCFGLSAARIHYTTHLPRGDPLNNGHNFYDPIVAELLATSFLTMIWAPFVVHMISGMREHRFFSRVWHELLGLFILWILFLVGAAIATSIWPNLPSFCSQFEACRLLDAMLAFAWLCWIALCAQIVITLIFASVNGSWNDPAHGRWVRDSTYSSRYPAQRA